MSKRILIFGNGQIGNLYLDYFNEIDYPVEISKADITDKNAVSKAITKYKPDVVINTAAKTNLEWCSENKLETFNVNVLGADNIAQVCDENGVHYIHFSSGCIFQSKDENDEKFEDSKPDPQAYYSLTKAWAEELIPWHKSDNFKWTILRPRQPISAKVNYKNMLMKVLTFQKFIDTPNTGTVLEDMLDWTKIIIDKEATGIYHLANPGWATPYQIGLMLKKYINPVMEIEKITKEELDELMPNRRVDTILNVDKLKSLGINPVNYEKRLEETIKKLAENLKNTTKAELQVQLDKTLDQTRRRTVPNKTWKKLLDLAKD